MEALPWGGSEELWSQAALRFLKQNQKVTANVKGWQETPSQMNRLQEAGCSVEYRHPGPRGIMQRIAKKVAHKAGMREEHWLDTQKPDFAVISQGDPYTGTEWAKQCRQRKIPYALVIQAAAEQWWPDDAYAADAAECYAAARAAYFVSQGNLNLVQIQLACTLTSAKVVRNPFSVSYDVAASWPEQEDTLRLACVGRLEPEAKGQDLLFDVLQQEKWKRRKLEVSLYGSGANAGTLKKLKQLYGLENVAFAGFTSNVEEIWQSHHALVLPSRFEGLPLALVEAMLCRRPVIVTDVAGNAELVEDGVTGFIAAAPTAVHLERAMERAWSQRDQLRQMGQLAGERVREKVMRDPVGAFISELSHLMR